MKKSIILLANSLRIGPKSQRLGTVLFGSTVSSIIPLSSSATALKNRISRLQQPRTFTATALGISAMTKLFLKSRPGARKVGIVITDGKSLSESDTLREAKRARARGVIMYAVGVGSSINKRELRGIASSRAHVIELTDFGQLQKSIRNLVNNICIGELTDDLKRNSELGTLMSLANNYFNQ